MPKTKIIDFRPISVSRKQYKKKPRGRGQQTNKESSMYTFLEFLFHFRNTFLLVGT